MHPRVTEGEKVRKETCFWAHGQLLANLGRDPVPILLSSLSGKCVKSDSNGAFGFLSSVCGTEKVPKQRGERDRSPGRPPQHFPGERGARPRAREGARGEASDFDRLAGGLRVLAFPGEVRALAQTHTLAGLSFLEPKWSPLKRPSNPGPKNGPGEARPSGPRRRPPGLVLEAPSPTSGFKGKAKISSSRGATGGCHLFGPRWCACARFWFGTSHSLPPAGPRKGLSCASGEGRAHL